MAIDAGPLRYEDDVAGDGDGEVVRPGAWELTALVVLVVAGVGLPVLGWMAGMAMVLLSRAWTTRDKAIAVAGPLWVLVALVVASAVAGGAAIRLGSLVLDLGPSALLLVFGGAIASVLGALWLMWRAFVLA